MKRVIFITLVLIMFGSCSTNNLFNEFNGEVELEVENFLSENYRYGIEIFNSKMIVCAFSNGDGFLILPEDNYLITIAVFEGMKVIYHNTFTFYHDGIYTKLCIEISNSNIDLLW